MSQAKLHKAANYYEPLIRARIARALRAARASVPQQQVAAAVMHRAPAHAVPAAKLQAALRPAQAVVRDALRHGGQVGASMAKVAAK